MKDNECRITLQNSSKWLLGAFTLWSFPLVYICLYLSPVSLLSPPNSPPLSLVSRFYVLFAILLSVKYLTFTNFPDVSSGKDEIRRLFTSISPFHMHIPASGILYPMLFKELGMVLGYARVSAWGSFYSMSLGVLSGLIYLFRHEYITYWFSPPYSRLKWLSITAPEVLVITIVVNIIFTALLNLVWLLWKYELGGVDYCSYGIVIYFVDALLTRVLQNFLAKPIRLDDENNLGEELAISGLSQKDVEIHFQCFQDLLRAPTARKLQIMDPKTSQWNILLDTAINYLSSVPRHIQNYTTLKNKQGVTYSRSSAPQSAAVSAANNLYFLFNEPFEVKFRNELFKMFTMAALASNVVTKFVTATGSHNFVLKDNSLSMILQMQAETLTEVNKYLAIDPEISFSNFRGSIVDNLIEIKAVYSDYLTSISLRGDTLQILHKLG